MTGIVEGFVLAAQTLPALLQAAAQVKASWELFQSGDITEEELHARWKKAGIKWQGTSASLKAAMDEAKGNG